MIVSNASRKSIALVVSVFALGLSYWFVRGRVAVRGFFSEPVRAQPSKADFVGCWKLEEASLPSVEQRTGKRLADSYLDIASDGRLRAVNMPIQDAFLKPEFQLVSRLGTWEFELKQTWMLTVAFEQDVYPLRIEWQGDRPTALVDPVPDGDSSERWVWRKVP